MFDNENSYDKNSFFFEKSKTIENEDFLNESFDLKTNEQNINNENYLTNYSTINEEINEKENLKKILEHYQYDNKLYNTSDENSENIEIIYPNEQINNNSFYKDEIIFDKNDFQSNINVENSNENIIKLIVKKTSARKDYLIKKMLSIISKYLIKKLKEKKSKFKKINLKSELKYEKLKNCLYKTIKELLLKNKKNEEIIDLHKNNEILKMEFKDFIYNNYETLNNQYKYYYYNEFKLKFENAKSFENLDSINKIINEIESTKGNKMKKK